MGRKRPESIRERTVAIAPSRAGRDRHGDSHDPSPGVPRCPRRDESDARSARRSLRTRQGDAGDAPQRLRLLYRDDGVVAFAGSARGPRNGHRRHAPAHADDLLVAGSPLHPVRPDSNRDRGALPARAGRTEHRGHAEANPEVLRGRIAEGASSVVRHRAHRRSVESRRPT